MASKAAKAVLRDTALTRMMAAAETLGTALGVPTLALLDYHRDPEYLEAVRLDAIAGYLEQVAEASKTNRARMTPRGKEPAHAS